MDQTPHAGSDLCLLVGIGFEEAEVGATVLGRLAELLGLRVSGPSAIFVNFKNVQHKHLAWFTNL
jgi:hypothetical protein